MTKPFNGFYDFAWNTACFTFALALLSLLHVGISVDHWTAFFWAGMVLFVISRSPIGLQADHWIALFFGSIVFALPFVFTRPLLILIGLPALIVTIACSLLLVNGLILNTLPMIITGFHVESFSLAVLVSLLLSFTTGILRHRLGPKPKPIKQPKPVKTYLDGEIIDI
jgi:putative membrane protein